MPTWRVSWSWRMVLLAATWGSASSSPWLDFCSQRAALGPIETLFTGEREWHGCAWPGAGLVLQGEYLDGPVLGGTRGCRPSASAGGDDVDVDTSDADELLNGLHGDRQWLLAGHFWVDIDKPGARHEAARAAGRPGRRVYGYGGEIEGGTAANAITTIVPALSSHPTTRSTRFSTNVQQYEGIVQTSWKQWKLIEGAGDGLPACP